jgi:hypothetical protein
MVYGLDIGFIEPLGTTSNYSATAYLNTLQFTTASVKPFSSLLCFKQSFPGSGF